jgi:hypothetical protein
MTSYHDYPTDEQLQFIRDYDIKQGPADLIEHLKEIWHWKDYLAYSQDHRAGYLELHTGGWSGNEDIIEAAGSLSILAYVLAEIRAGWPLRI